MEHDVQRIEPAPQLDFSQLAPVVSEFQKGEIAKLQIQSDTQIAMNQAHINRQMQIDRSMAAEVVRQDLYQAVTTAALFIGYAGLSGYGMWNHDNGFVVAGVTGFASFLAGRHNRGKPNA